MTPKNEVRLILAIEKIAEILLHSLYPRATEATAPIHSYKETGEQLKSHASTDSKPSAGHRVMEYLATLDVQIRTTLANNAMDNTLSTTALFMGEHFPHLKELLGRIKSSLAFGGQFNLDMKGRSKEVISANCQLATDLYKIAFLEHYQFQKAPRYVIVARPSSMPAAQQFLTGKWFEIYCREKILALLRESGLGTRLDYLRNIRVRLPDGEDFEFDFLLMVDEELFWFEQKTGSYQHHLERYSRLAGLLGLDAHHAFLILLEVGDETSRVLSDLCKMTVCNIGNFEEAVQNIMVRLGNEPGADTKDEMEIEEEPDFHVLLPTDDEDEIAVLR